MSLWDWVVAANAAPGAEAILLDLQDTHGCCVCYLLWAAWSAKAGRPAGAEDLARAAAIARRWERRTTAPLRSVRRALKPAWPDIDDAARLDLRARVKSDELEAERILLRALEALAPSGAHARAAVGESLEAAFAAWDASADRAAVADALGRLARIFEGLEV